MGDEPVLESQAQEYAEQWRADRRRRARRLARTSRALFVFGAVAAAVLMVVWIFGMVAASSVQFRLLALGAATLLGLSFLLGALAAATDRAPADAPADASTDAEEAEDAEAEDQPKKVRPTS